MPNTSSLLRSLMLAALLIVCGAQAAELPSRPRIGLVLGGGGARGAAHIGVLEVLEKMRVPVDCIAGTSMGALVAGSYAAGLSPAVMREQLGKADWNDMFIDNPDYSEMSFRNKTMLRNYLPGSETGITSEGARYQPGVVAGQKIKLFFNQLVRANQGERNIEDLPLPLSIIATDIGNGDRVVFRDGSLTKAMRASMSVPGLLAPVDHQGRKLVDGGLVDNVPISEVKERCKADVVIAVNVGSPLLKPEEVGSLLSVSAQMVNILTEQNVTRSLAQLTPQDVYIKPDLNGISAGDFPRHAETADRGRVAAEALIPQLQKLSQPEAVYLAWWQGIEGAPRVSPVIDEVEVAGLKRVNPAVVERHLTLGNGTKVRPNEINRDLLRMYGDGYYEAVDYSVLTQRDRNILRVMPLEKSWGPDYLRLAMHLEADASKGSTFGLRAAYHKTLINQLGGELIASVDVGNVNRLGGDYYQPLDAAQRYFVETTALTEQTRTTVFQNDQRIAQYNVYQSALGVYGGVNVGLLGQIRMGWLERKRRAELDTGTPSLPDGDVTFGGVRLALDFDQMNRMYFPTDGWSARFVYFDSQQSGYSRIDGQLQGAMSWGNTVFNARASYSGSPRGQLPIYDAASLGGPQNLSAYAQGQIIGDDIAYAGLRAEQIIGRLPLGLRGDMRLGISLEVARAGYRYTETQRDGLLDSLGLYVGGETPLGPVYLGMAYSSSGVSNFFLSIGVK
ncbi:patatin [Dechloromonas denitrificans]|uniref:Patatin n=1 Tax=Dechloromonas denitrificans TaxID=281362 RepID=A0A133XGR5_9RHOO|nr:patatin-like phospholipase family protein [Dechloromonas denitrificans]KXB30109.1 patatin [Dechloromonas denitrificans]